MNLKIPTAILASIFSHIVLSAAAAILLARLLLFFFPNSGLAPLFLAQSRDSLVPLKSVHVASQMARAKDPNTNSNVDAFVVKHCHYDWIVDFERVGSMDFDLFRRVDLCSHASGSATESQKFIHGHVDHTVETVQAASEIILDTAALDIKSASLVDGNSTTPLTFTLGDSGIYGRALRISLGEKPGREVG
jgi:hypothetical protein